MFFGRVVSANNTYKSTYFQVKGHLLATEFGLEPCKGVDATKQREMEKEDKIGSRKVVAASKKQKEDDLLPFLRKPTTTSIFGSGTTSKPQEIS